MASDEFEREQEDAAAAQAGAIGGAGNDDELQDDPAQRPLAEAGEGEAEGFEQAERELIENASHGDQHAARRAIEDASQEPDDQRVADSAEADSERSSEREQDW